MAAGGEGRDNHLGPVPPKLFRRHYIRASIFDRLNQTTNAFVLVQETQLARMQRCVMLTQVYSNICILYSEMDLLNKLMSRNLVVFFFSFWVHFGLIRTCHGIVISTIWRQYFSPDVPRAKLLFDRLTLWSTSLLLHLCKSRATVDRTI